MNIAILGSTSLIARDLIEILSKSEDYILYLFSRRPSELRDYYLENNLDSKRLNFYSYNDFKEQDIYEVIINFVGVGDPAKAKKIGNEIFFITEFYDNMALTYLHKNPTSQYIFISSGAAYLSNFIEPASEKSIGLIDINNINPQNWYSLAKLNAEVKHRAHSNLSIIDIRVFNYFSSKLDINSRFLIAEIVRSIKEKTTFVTSSEEIYRDFITPLDFSNLIISIINSNKKINTSVDCFSKSPVSKSEMLSELSKKFGLSYSIEDNEHGLNATGTKTNYFSILRRDEFNYIPQESSLSGIIKEVEKYLFRNNEKNN